MPILLMETSVVHSAMQQMRSSIENMQQLMQSSQQSAGRLDWQGQAREQFIADYQQEATRLLGLLHAGEDLASRVDQEVNQWEELNRLLTNSMLSTIPEGVGGSFGSGGGGWVGTGGDASTSGDPLYGFVKALKLNKDVRDIIEWGIVPALIAVNVHAGVDGKVNLTGSHLMKEFFLGVKGGFTRSNADTLVKGITKANFIFEAGSLAIDWAIDVGEHRHEGWEAVGKAMLASTGEAGGGVVGGVVGTKVGAAIGTILMPGIGTVIGGVVGNVAGTIIGEKVGGGMVDGIMNYKPLWSHSNIDENLQAALNGPLTGALNWVNERV